MLEEIDTLRKIVLANRELTNAQESKTNAHEEKTNLFLTELKVLRTDRLFLTSKVETMSKSLSELQYGNIGLTKKIEILGSLDANNKIQWERE